MTTATKTRKRRQPTEAQKQAAAERRARISGLVRKIAAMTPDEREAMARRLPVVKISGEPYSRTNAILILFQGGAGATMLGGFNQWKAQGRSVKKGEHGFSIWIPCGKKETDPETGATISSSAEFFTMQSVFDISQTVEIEGAAT